MVNVSVSRPTPVAAQLPFQGVPEDDPFFQFFRRFGPPQPQGGQPLQRGQGSGFIVSPDGVILTNAHVVADATDITVKLTDRREFEARVVGVDRRSDTAVLKIDAKDLPAVKIGDPARLKVGEWVAAIGSPFCFLIHPVFLWAGDWTTAGSGSASPEHAHQKTVTAMDARDAKENRESAASTAARAARRPGLTGIVLGTLAYF